MKNIETYNDNNNSNIIPSWAMTKMEELLKVLSLNNVSQSSPTTLEKKEVWREVIPDRRHNASDCTARKPALTIADWQRIRYNQRWKGYRFPIIILKASGAMGTDFSNYATTYAIGRAYNVTVGLTKVLHEKLIKTFPNISLPIIDIPDNETVVVPFRKSYIYGEAEAAAAGLMGPKHFLIHMCSMVEIQLFSSYPCEIRKEFTFNQVYQEKVKDFWSKNNFGKDSVLVGFHIRRGDYDGYARAHREQLPNKTYFDRAMNFYRNKFSNVTFVVATNGLKYVKENLKDSSDVIYAPGTNSREHMAILNSCNHSIITVGTYGFWTGYLAGGYVAYPKEFYIPFYPVQKDRYEMANLDFFVPISYK